MPETRRCGHAHDGMVWCADCALQEQDESVARLRDLGITQTTRVEPMPPEKNLSSLAHDELLHELVTAHSWEGISHPVYAPDTKRAWTEYKGRVWSAVLNRMEG